MAFKSLLFFALSAALLVKGAPTEASVETTNEVVKLEPESVTALAAAAATPLITVCNNADFSGSCITFVGNLNTCYSLGAYDNVVSSARPASSGVYCYLYDYAGCGNRGPIITGPANNLIEQGFNDRATSFHCWLP